MKDRTKVVLSIIGVFLLAIVTIGVSYAFFNYSKEGTTTNVITVGNLKFLYTEISGVGNGISMTDALPMSDTEGKAQSGKGKVFDFKVEAKTTGAASIPYEITAMKTDASTLDQSVVKLYLTEADGTEVETNITKTGSIYGTLNDCTIPGSKGKTIYQSEVSANSASYIKNFKFRMWIDEDTDFTSGNYNGKTFTIKINVYANAQTPNYADNSGAAQPELESNMIPVLYNETSGNWEKADVKTKWYDYDQKQWANAVVVKETGTKTRTEYLSAKEGTPISMDDILQMLVWIPRYKYVMPAAKEGQVDIVFENKKTEKSTGTATGTSYLTHPAFTFGTTELNGLWVGKFESSSDIACTTSTGAQGTNCDLTNIKPQIKPNVKSWTGARVSTFFTVSRNAQAKGNPYGYNQSGVDTHMMKNSEWGAVAYLTQSKYGRCTNGTCTEVTMNNLNSGDGRTITGCAADTITASELRQADCPDTNRYNTEKGVLASTTGNIYGIYDMAGGDWEYVMGNYNKYSGYTAISYTKEQAATILGRTDDIAVGIWNSGFNGPVYGKALDNTTALSWTTGIDFPEERYYDLYTTDKDETSCNGKPCLGHALSEIAGWYSDYPYHIHAAGPWFIRGGGSTNNSNAGIWSYSSNHGRSYHSITSRLVVSKD